MTQKDKTGCNNVAYRVKLPKKTPENPKSNKIISLSWLVIY